MMQNGSIQHKEHYLLYGLQCWFCYEMQRIQKKKSCLCYTIFTYIYSIQIEISLLYSFTSVFFIGFLSFAFTVLWGAGYGIWKYLWIYPKQKIIFPSPKKFKLNFCHQHRKTSLVISERKYVANFFSPLELYYSHFRPSDFRF